MSDIDDVLEGAKLSEQTCSIPMRGDLVSEHQALDAELRAMGEFTQSHLGEADPRAPIAAQLANLEADIAASEVTFTFRALGRRKYRELLNAHPGRADRGETRFNGDTFPRELIALCCVSHSFTPADVDRLFDALNEGGCELLFITAFHANEGVTRVPFSKAASVVTQRLELNS